MAQGPDEVALRGHPEADSRTPASPETPAERIRTEIEATRTDMSETIDAIKARLSPAHLMADATHTVKETIREGAHRVVETASAHAKGLGKTSSRTARDVLEKVRNNPVSMAFIGLAATALMVRAFGRRRCRAVRKRTSTFWMARRRPRQNKAITFD
jgi:hypothetical protein